MKGHKTSYVAGNLEKQIVGLVRDITGNPVVQKKGLNKEQSQSIINKITSCSSQSFLPGFIKIILVTVKDAG